MKIHDVEQGTDAWMRVRIGKVTASELDQLVTPKFAERTGQMPFSYLCKKVAEAYRGKPLMEDDFSSYDTEQGQLLEMEARKCFCFEFAETKLRNVGFCEHDGGRFGCSPDALIGEDSGCEIKCPKSKTHVRYILEGKLPDDYAAQVHGSIYATGAKSWTFFSYARRFPPFVLKVERDEVIMLKIENALKSFALAFDDAMKRLKEMNAA